MPKHQFTCAVQPEYQSEQSQPEAGQYVFAYTVTVSNTGAVAAQLVARHWEIEDAHGHTQVVDGLGVIGRQPLLQPGETFEYTSGCQLRTPNGSMQGTYLCISHEGEVFECPIPRFHLQSGAGGDSFPDPDNRVLH